jgi:hypothetical protein
MTLVTSAVGSFGFFNFKSGTSINFGLAQAVQTRLIWRHEDCLRAI